MPPEPGLTAGWPIMGQGTGLGLSMAHSCIPTCRRPQRSIHMSIDSTDYGNDRQIEDPLKIMDTIGVCSPPS